MPTVEEPLWPMGIFAPDPRELKVVVHPAFNAEPRRPTSLPMILLLHYTGMPSGPKAVDWLARAESRVSCHYVVDADGTLTQLVPEAYRAWHAGQAFWAGETDINSCSIGIEIQNPGHEHGYAEFGSIQMAAVSALSRDIITRHAIAPGYVLAHSDVAPGRKIDPGEKFPWHQLAYDGVGLWVTPVAVDVNDRGHGLGSVDSLVRQAQMRLRDYGYNCPVTGTLDATTETVLAAFQRHFRPARVDGRLDLSTFATLTRLSAARHAQRATMA